MVKREARSTSRNKGMLLNGMVSGHFATKHLSTNEPPRIELSFIVFMSP